MTPWVNVKQCPPPHTPQRAVNSDLWTVMSGLDEYWRVNISLIIEINIKVI